MSYRDENEALRGRLEAVEAENRALKDAAERAKAPPAPVANARPAATAGRTGTELAARAACVLSTVAAWGVTLYLGISMGTRAARRWRSPHSLERESAWVLVALLLATVLLANALVTATLWQRSSARTGIFVSVFFPTLALLMPIGGLIAAIIVVPHPFRGHVGGGGSSSGGTTTSYQEYPLRGLRYFVAVHWLSIALCGQAILFEWSALAYS